MSSLEKRRESARNWRKNNRARYNKMMCDWNAANPEKVRKTSRKRRLKANFGITPEQYEEMLAAQGGHCALCDRTPDQERYGRLSVDHCHQTRRVRGLLCIVHNSSIASLGDDEAGLLRTLKYVKGGV